MHLEDRTHTWTDADLALLARLIRRKWPASRIAPVFHVTRNAVLGKIHRHDELKLLMPKRPPKKPPVDKWVKPLKLKKGKDYKVLEPEAETPREPLATPVFPVKQPMDLMPLMDTGSQFCKWPIRRDSAVIGHWLCCGRPVVWGAVYCEDHRRKARAGSC